MLNVYSSEVLSFIVIFVQNVCCLEFKKLWFVWGLNYSGNMMSWICCSWQPNNLNRRKSFSSSLLHLSLSLHPNIPYSSYERHNCNQNPLNTAMEGSPMSYWQFNRLKSWLLYWKKSYILDHSTSFVVTNLHYHTISQWQKTQKRAKKSYHLISVSVSSQANVTHSLCLLQKW